MIPTAILIGDPHVKRNRLEDFRFALNRIAEEVTLRKPTYTICLGDAFDTFSVIHSEVLSVWNNFVNSIYDKTILVFLVGNHDMAGPTGNVHALEVFRGRAIIVDELTELTAGIFCLPFFRDKEKFERVCQDLPDKSVLLCHQSFDGASFENGFFDPHGAAIDSVEHLTQVITGHIHRNQSIANVWYPGTPYQQGYTDAGENKVIFYGSLSQEGFKTHDVTDLGLSQFIHVQADSIPQLLSILPEPNPVHCYKLEATGTLQEINEFWKDPKVVIFKKSVKAVKDALKSIRPQTILTQVKGKTLEERLIAFINAKDWKVSRERIVEHARRFIQETS